jgi:hypothetical protein
MSGPRPVWNERPTVAPDGRPAVDRSAPTRGRNGRVPLRGRTKAMGCGLTGANEHSPSGRYGRDGTGAARPSRAAKKSRAAETATAALCALGMERAPFRGWTGASAAAGRQGRNERRRWATGTERAPPPATQRE